MKKKGLLSCSVISIIVIPILLNYFIVGNSYYSKASNDGWISFFGSYASSIITGIITLVVMRKTIIDGRKNLEKSIEENKKLQTRNERINLTNEIATLVGEYCQDICKYYYDCKDAERYDRKSRKLEDEKRNGLLDNDEYQLKRDRLEKDRVRGNRGKAISILFIIQIKLKNIPEAEEVVNLMCKIHNDYVFSLVRYNEFEDNIEELKSKTSDFIKNYLEKQ